MNKDKQVTSEISSETLRAQKLQKVFERSLRAFNAVQEASQEEREKCVRDRRFCWIAGAQWEDFWSEQWENRPKLEINKVQLAVTRIFNEYRSNRISATFVPADGSKDEDITGDLNSLYRANRQAGGTDFVDNAFIDSITGGIGGWRLRTEYENPGDPESDEQVIVFESIPDADKRLFFDLGAVKQDKSDAKKCWILTGIPSIEYEELYEDKPASWPSYDSTSIFDWYSADTVFLAEYFEIEEEKITIHTFGGLDGDEKKISHEEYKDHEFMAELDAMGYRELRNKKITRRRVHKYIMSGGGILEDCGYIAGEYLPGIIVYGKRSYIDNLERVSGHVRTCIDSQRLHNVQTSKLAEIAAYSSVEKPVFTPEQVLGHETRWSRDLIDNMPYLLINQTYDQNGAPIPAAPSAYTRSPQVPPVMGALLDITNGDLNDLTGNQQNGEAVKSNVSGLAMELAQSSLSMQTSGYVDNLKIAERHGAKVWLSMAKEVYVEEGRKIKGITESGESEQIELNMPSIDEDGYLKIKNDFAALGKMDVIVEVGPSSESKRSATEKGLTGLMSVVQDPETLAVIGNMILANSDGEGMAEIRPYFRDKLIKIGALEPTEEEIKKLEGEKQEPPPPTPEQQANTDFLAASAEAEKAKADNLRAQTIKVQAEAKQVLANTQKILADAQLSAAKADEIERNVIP